MFWNGRILIILDDLDSCYHFRKAPFPDPWFVFEILCFSKWKISRVQMFGPQKWCFIRLDLKVCTVDIESSVGTSAMGAEMWRQKATHHPTIPQVLWLFRRVMGWIPTWIHQPDAMLTSILNPACLSQSCEPLHVWWFSTVDFQSILWLVVWNMFYRSL